MQNGVESCQRTREKKKSYGLRLLKSNVFCKKKKENVDLRVSNFSPVGYSKHYFAALSSVFKVLATVINSAHIIEILKYPILNKF